jgi:hypothetical protein
MPSPFLLATAGRPSELYCSLCKTKLVRPDLSSQPTAHEAKAALLKQWDDHLYALHRRQWERNQKKRARRIAAIKQIAPKTIGNLPLPKRLISLIDSVLWPTTPDRERRQDISLLVTKERIQSFAPEQDRLYLFRPPFRTIAQRMDGREGTFWSKWGALAEITPELALDIGDFGLGADSAIVLDYRYENPPHSAAVAKTGA